MLCRRRHAGRLVSDEVPAPHGRRDCSLGWALLLLPPLLLPLLLGVAAAGGGHQAPVAVPLLLTACPCRALQRPSGATRARARPTTQAPLPALSRRQAGWRAASGACLGRLAGMQSAWKHRQPGTTGRPGVPSVHPLQDASPEGGSAPACADNVRAAWRALRQLADSGGAGLLSSQADTAHETRTCSCFCHSKFIDRSACNPPAEEGRQTISGAMRLCEDSTLDSSSDVLALRDWAASAWDYLVGMGSRGVPGVGAELRCRHATAAGQPTFQPAPAAAT